MVATTIRDTPIRIYHSIRTFRLWPYPHGTGGTLSFPEHQTRTLFGQLEWLRPPHIHFAVIPEGGTPWLTQMSFAGEALNKRDFLRNLPSDVVREQVIIDFQTTENAPDARAKLGVFDIALGMPGVTRDKA